MQATAATESPSDDGLLREMQLATMRSRERLNSSLLSLMQCVPAAAFATTAAVAPTIHSGLSVLQNPYGAVSAAVLGAVAVGFWGAAGVMVSKLKNALDVRHGVEAKMENLSQEDQSFMKDFLSGRRIPQELAKTQFSAAESQAIIAKGLTSKLPADEKVALFLTQEHSPVSKREVLSAARQLFSDASNRWKPSSSFRSEMANWTPENLEPTRKDLVTNLVTAHYYANSESAYTTRTEYSVYKGPSGGLLGKMAEDAALSLLVDLKSSQRLDSARMPGASLLQTLSGDSKPNKDKGLRP